MLCVRHWQSPLMLYSDSTKKYYKILPLLPFFRFFFFFTIIRVGLIFDFQISTCARRQVSLSVVMKNASCCKNHKMQPSKCSLSACVCAPQHIHFHIGTKKWQSSLGLSKFVWPLASLTQMSFLRPPMPQFNVSHLQVHGCVTFGLSWQTWVRSPLLSRADVRLRMSFPPAAAPPWPQDLNKKYFPTLGTLFW